MTWVTSRLLRPDGTAAVGQCVVITLKTRPSWLTNRTGQVLGQARVNTDSTGLWRVDLLPYTDFETADDVYYEVSEGNDMPVWLIRVPPPSVPPVDLWMRDLLIEAPTPLSSPWLAISTLGQLHNVDNDANAASPGYVLGTKEDGNWGLVSNTLPDLLDVDAESLLNAKPGDQLVLLDSGKWGVLADPFQLDVEWEVTDDDGNAVTITIHGSSRLGARVLWGDGSDSTDTPQEQPVRHTYPGPGIYTVTVHDKAYPTVTGTATVAIKDAVVHTLESDPSDVTGMTTVLTVVAPDPLTVHVAWGDGFEEDVTSSPVRHAYGHSGTFLVAVSHAGGSEAYEFLSIPYPKGAG